MQIEQERISIWFFIGLMLIASGLLVCGAGLWDYWHPPAQPTVLAELHAGVWWGAVLLAAGLFYSLRFAPRRG
jgi:hypothetical protein